jgi:hypothetical protein
MADIDYDTGQDDETRGLIRLVERGVTPSLKAAGWRCLYPGEDGLGCWAHLRRGLRLIHSVARELDGDCWAHVSVSSRSGFMPSWGQTRDCWRLIYPNLAGVIVIPATDKHVNLAEVAHVWGNLTRPAVPDFTHGLGTI